MGRTISSGSKAASLGSTLRHAGNNIVGELRIEGDVAVRKASLCGTLSLSLVRGQVEGDEENEVGGEDATASECSEFFTRT